MTLFEKSKREKRKMIEDIEIKKRKLDDEGGQSNVNVFTFFSAVKASDLLAVKQAIEFGIDVNSKDRYGDTALMKASDGTTEILKCLLESGSDVNARDCRGATALMYASEAGPIGNVELLIECGARVDLCDAYGQTAVVYALKNPLLETLCYDFSNHIRCIALLLDHDPTDNTVDHVDKKGQTYLIHAAYSITAYPSNDLNRDQMLRTAYQIECVKLLIEKRIDLVDDMSNNVKHKIIRKGMNDELKETLLDYLNGWYEQSSDDTIHDNNIERIKPYLLMLVEAGVEERLSAVLNHFASQGSFALVLMIAKLSPNTFESPNLVQALISACSAYHPDEEKISFLLEVGVGVDVNSIRRYGRTALHTICLREVPESIFADNIHRCVCLLLDRGARFDIYDDDNYTPMHYAAMCSLSKVVQEFLKRGADANIRNSVGATPMSVACEESSYEFLNRHSKLVDVGSVEMLQLLLSRGGLVNVKDTEHVPLIKACGSKRPGCVQFLLEHGAEVNATTPKHVTALMEASLMGSLCNVLLLLEHGADVNAVDAEGKSALLYACRLYTWRKTDLGCVKALLRHGADIDQTDSQGRTALMLAAMGPSVDEASRILLGLNPITDIQFALVTLLLERGADLAVADNEGRTVRDLTDINQLVRAELDKAQHSSDHVLK